MLYLLHTFATEAIDQGIRADKQPWPVATDGLTQDPQLWHR